MAQLRPMGAFRALVILSVAGALAPHAPLDVLSKSISRATRNAAACQGGWSREVALAPIWEFWEQNGQLEGSPEALSSALYLLGVSLPDSSVEDSLGLDESATTRPSGILSPSYENSSWDEVAFELLASRPVSDFSGLEVLKMTWAIRRLGFNDIEADVDGVLSRDDDYVIGGEGFGEARPVFAQCCLKAASFLRAEAQMRLPWRVFPRLCEGLSVSELKKEIKFGQDVLITKSGNAVIERRATKWLAEPGIGGLAYSGKVMPPAPLLEASSVVDARDRLRDVLNVNFDCVLCNLYQDEKSACRWHADPEHGKMWSLDTVVVSAGETRRFALRRVDNKDEVFAFHVFAGDAVWMFGDCQDTWHHAVLGPETVENNGERMYYEKDKIDVSSLRSYSDPHTSIGVSLVFKRALLGPTGKKGHGIPKKQGGGRGTERQRRSGRGGRAALPGRGQLPKQKSRRGQRGDGGGRRR